MTEPNNNNNPSATSNMEDSIRKLISLDGSTVARPSEIFPTIPSSSTPNDHPSLSKDISLNSISLRLFLPRHHPSTTTTTTTTTKNKLHLIIYVHGGGFVFATPAYPSFHHFCSYAASHLSALVVSVDYRLAPEHRLPAAYDDVLEALTWVRDGQHEWITEYADLSSCVLMGDSAGANIVYNAALSASSIVDRFKPLTITGLVLIQPFFGGLDRTESELRLVNDPLLPLGANDLFWELSLPFGADRNHEYCDPIRDGGSGLLDQVRDLGWRVWVVSCDGDPLYDRSVELVKLMEKRGLSVNTLFCEGGEHGVFVGDPNDTSKFKALELLDFVKGFFS